MKIGISLLLVGLFDPALCPEGLVLFAVLFNSIHNHISIQTKVNPYEKREIYRTPHFISMKFTEHHILLA